MDDKIFFEAAIFECKRCGLKEEIYSQQEWLEEVNEPCPECGKSDVRLFDPIILSHWDDELNGICPVIVDAPYPDEFCKQHDIVGKFRWTELVFDHKECGVMHFVEFTNGKHRDYFEKINLAPKSQVQEGVRI